MNLKVSENPEEEWKEIRRRLKRRIEMSKPDPSTIDESATPVSIPLLNITTTTTTTQGGTPPMPPKKAGEDNHPKKEKKEQPPHEKDRRRKPPVLNKEEETPYNSMTSEPETIIEPPSESPGYMNNKGHINEVHMNDTNDKVPVVQNREGHIDYSESHSGEGHIGKAYVSESYVSEDYTGENCTGSDSPTAWRALELGEKSAIILLRELKSGRIAPGDLNVKERRAVVYVLRQAGKTQDEISGLLQVSRRTIVSDCSWLRKQIAIEIARKDASDFGAEVYEVGTACIRGAMQDGKWRSASYIMRDMIEVLQSLGLVYKAPTSTKLAAIVGHASLDQGYQKYMDRVAPEADQVSDVLADLMKCIDN